MLDSFPYAKVQDYLSNWVPDRPREMQRMEKYAEKTGFPIISPTSGYICFQIARMVNAKDIFEMGSGYGYSTAWFAEAVKENGGGSVHHVVWDEELSTSAKHHLDQLGYSEIIEYHVGEAVQTLQEIRGPFDLIFNDIDKEAYATSLPTIAEKIKPGGVLIVDNSLWGGRVFNGGDGTGSANAILDLTQKLMESPEWVTSILPISDGLILAYKV